VSQGSARGVLLQQCPPQGGTSPGVPRLEFDASQGRLQRFFVPPRPEECGCDIGAVHQRIELLGALHHRECLIVPPERGIQPPAVVVDANALLRVPGIGVPPLEIQLIGVKVPRGFPTNPGSLVG
jgi:hypothetical protein